MPAHRPWSLTFVSFAVEGAVASGFSLNWRRHEAAPVTHQDQNKNAALFPSLVAYGDPRKPLVPCRVQVVASFPADRFLVLAQRLASPTPGWLTAEASSPKTVGEGNG